MKMILTTTLLSVIAAGAVAQTGEPLPASLQGVKRIVCLGDSITQGGESKGGYVWLLRTYLKNIYPEQGFEVLNSGIGGHKSNDMLARFKRDVLDKKPDLVTISVGVNDVWHGYTDFDHGYAPIPSGDGPRRVPLEAYIKNVEAMVSQAEAAKIRVVMLSTTVIYEDLKSSPNQRLVKYNAALRDIAKKHHALFIDFQKPFKTLISDYQRVTGGRNNLLTSDGVHMNGAGNQVMAHTILSGLGVSPEARAKVQEAVQNAH